VSVRIKICGVTDADDADAAVQAGADLIGLNFVPGSPRSLDLRVAEAVAERIAGQAERVAVFANAAWDEIERVTRRIDLERIQFHGDESEEEVEMVDLPVIKAIRGADLEAAAKYPAALLLLDHPTEGGGRGRSWPWSDAATLIAQGYDVILAGGLDPDNVDVATGVEAEGEGNRKDRRRIERFIAAVRAAEAGE
jgi:phosphoribosylanthranilate isomerase